MKPQERPVSQPIRLIKKLGQGAENEVFLIQDDAPESSQESKARVLKVPTFFGRLWQTQGREFIEKCLDAFRKKDIQLIQTEVKENIIATLPNHEIVHIPTATEHPFISDIDETVLNWEHLNDPVLGPKIIEQMITILEKTLEIEEEYQLGIDLYGGTLAVKILQGVFQKLLLDLLESTELTKLIADKINGIRGEISNLSVIDDKVVVSDHGLFDFSETGKLKPVTRMIYHAAITGSKTLLDEVNAIHEERVDEARIKAIPYKGPKILSKIIDFILLKVMIPLYERHSHQQRKTKLQEKFASSQG